jgi:hypothetical protein
MFPEMSWHISPKPDSPEILDTPFALFCCVYFNFWGELENHALPSLFKCKFVTTVRQFNCLVIRYYSAFIAGAENEQKIFEDMFVTFLPRDFFDLL